MIEQGETIRGRGLKAIKLAREMALEQEESHDVAVGSESYAFCVDTMVHYLRRVSAKEDHEKNSKKESETEGAAGGAGREEHGRENDVEALDEKKKLPTPDKVSQTSSEVKLETWKCSTTKLFYVKGFVTTP
ncbi:hypothetical protein PV326_006599 [Microctonus aethiopoides]|uniref:Uncharacterized protein n=1 Tax=Microctonus aethiopoides TaxID=144406 RepID=A0AA39KSJ2_9HYME|nr:hypothetical protein PV326_006599 [Microctonus aethiopoides]KAK0172210.1 hypothetical protein PV328_005557 [Microctonus aethiopoides]